MLKRRTLMESIGQWLAYTPRNRDFRTCKRYRGGWASEIWLFHLDNHTSEKITDWEGTDTIPMWQGRKIYYLSGAKIANPTKSTKGQ